MRKISDRLEEVRKQVLEGGEEAMLVGLLGDIDYQTIGRLRNLLPRMTDDWMRW
jgi:hypothetical protein